MMVTKDRCKLKQLIRVVQMTIWHSLNENQLALSNYQPQTKSTHLKAADSLTKEDLQSSNRDQMRQMESKMLPWWHSSTTIQLHRINNSHTA